MKRYDPNELIRLRDSHFYDSFEMERAQKYRELDEFKKVFSRESLKTMKIEDYVQGLGSNDSFCYHIERTFGCFGNISSSSAYKFGIFFSKSRNQYEYYPKWGDSAEEAYDNVRDSILDLLKCGDCEDTHGIVNNMLAPIVKGKILHLYFPNRYFSIYSDRHLSFYLDFYGLLTPSLRDSDTFYKQEVLLNFKNSDPVMKDWSIDKFATFLYHVYPRSPKRQDDDMTHSSTKRQHHSNPVFTRRHSAPLATKPQPTQYSSEIEEKLKEITVGSPVHHKKFGDGQITNIFTADKSIHVMFSMGEKKFVYPDAFHMGFLEIV